MDRNTQKHFKTLLDTDSDKFLEKLSTCVKNNEDDKVRDLLTIMKKNPETLHCVKSYREDEDETLLHIAVKNEYDKNTISRLIDICPDLLSLSRELSDNYKGQTPLHIAITKGDNDVTELLLSSAENQAETGKKQSSNRIKMSMINTLATGRMFVNTVMMGELPLSVASLTFNEDAVNILLEHGADLHAQNRYGDTVLHSLVKYSAVYPNKTDNVIEMFKYLNGLLKEDKSNNPCFRGIDLDIFLEEDSYVWFLENCENLTPLQLSAKLGVVEIFQFFINLENVYSFVSTQDGLFDVKLYDITEIDTVANQHVAMLTTRNKDSGNKTVSRNIDGVSRTNIKKSTEFAAFQNSHFDYPETESILEMMFDYEFRGSSAFRIIETIPVKNIIQDKWQKLRYLYFLWGFCHILMTVCLTAEIVIRSNIYASITWNPNNTVNADMLSVNGISETFVHYISWISFIFGGIVYCLFVILLLIAKVRRANAMRYILHNIGYVSFLFVFSICLFVDFFMTQVSVAHDNIALIIAIIAGWWFAVFFLRAVRLFSFFTEMIRRVIIGDLLRFAVILSFMLFAFTAGMYAVFVGKVESQQQQSADYASAIDENFGSFGGTMMTMFKLMLGLGDIEFLNQARIPGLAIALYVIFVILTYVLLINSLIAMMSQTCAVVLEDRYSQWRLQQLSVILFTEDLFCLPCIRRIFGSPGTEREISGFDPVTKQKKSYSRYFLKIHSLQTMYASEEDRAVMEKTLKEQPERPRIDGTMRSDHSSLNYNLSPGRMHQQPPRIRRRPQLKTRLPDTYTTFVHSLRFSRQLSRIIEKKIKKQTAMKLGSEPDLVKSGKTPDTKRRRYHSENDKESRNSTQPIASFRGKDGSLTPVGSELDVHTHNHVCPEIEERLVPKRHLHVDIEPYQYSNA
jgi:transient receptor potential cation channel subfamily V protein 2